MYMDTQPHIYVWMASFLFFWKCGQVNGSQTKKNTWKEAVLDCYGSNSFLESNVTILKNYMRNNTEVKSIWVGGFEALLPWIEIRGCYIIPYTRNSLNRDELITENPALCQLKCMKRQYFAYNQLIKRCVCFDQQNTVEKESLNPSICNECSLQGNCNIYAVAYKVSDMSVKDNYYDCLSYQCESPGAMPIFNETQCTKVRKSYCRDGSSAVGSTDQTFFQYNTNCQEKNFKYPLLHSENPVNLCNVSKLKVPGIHIWVGVYRQRLHIDKFDKTVLQAFKHISKYISKCQHLQMNDVARPQNCENQVQYICTSDSAIGETDNQRSGIIAGTLTSILVIVVVVVVVVIIYRRRFMSKAPKLNDKRSKENKHRNNVCDGQFHETSVTLGPYSFAKPLSDNNVRREKAAEDENEYSRIVSAVFAASNKNEETNNCNANPGYNDVQMNYNKTNPIGYKDSSNSLPNATISGDYCLAKPIPNPGEIDPYTDNADYDHLGNVKNRDNYTEKVYDHVPNIIDSDETYDHSTITICKSESDNYDHFDVQN
ncbi:uncharacterized protein LOC143055517 [Mytilus galloprovincialis]|uniref:uncharacterized protein LOC143055517 n=1 Tax=Mytilus galloprovincialis TaxID=29158 RepID=UPI003F7C0DFE